MLKKSILLMNAVYVITTFSLIGQNKYGLVIHGGAGTITRKNMTEEKEKAYRKSLGEALNAGYTILENGGTSLDAVEAAVRIELDASIMDGSTLQAGAVTGVKTIKNPITASRKVMEETWHVVLGGEGADHFAKEQGLEIVDNAYFHTDRRWKSLQKAKDKEKHGTVGCVALDKNGNLAAGTSTGGLTNKRWGRIGDSPIIGAGTYADNKTCGVSGTGQGEYFIRGNIAYDVSAMMEYKSISVSDAAKQVIEKLTARGGRGGVIAMDSNGNIAMPFNTEGMYRGHMMKNQDTVIRIYKD